MLEKVFAITAAVMLAAGAQAATISNIGGAESVDGSSGTTLTGATLSGTYSTATASEAGVTRSVYEGTSSYGDAYFSVGAGEAATLNIDSSIGTADSLSFLIGSPDSYNHISFLLDGASVFSFDGTDVPGDYTAGLGAVYVTVSDLTFDQVIFASDKPALEFSNVSFTGTQSRALVLGEEGLTTVPVPASGVLLLGALGAVSVMRRRKR